MKFSLPVGNIPPPTYTLLFPFTKGSLAAITQFTEVLFVFWS